MDYRKICYCCGVAGGRFFPCAWKATSNRMLRVIWCN